MNVKTLVVLGLIALVFTIVEKVLFGLLEMPAPSFTAMFAFLIALYLFGNKENE